MAATQIGKIAVTAGGTWNATTAYPVITVVTSADGKSSYISKKDVPAGTALTNAEYWQKIVEAADVEVDPTLTQEGEAADAKATGDKFSSIITEVRSTNMYNKNSSLNRDNVKIESSGDYSVLNGSSASHPIKIEAGKTYCFKFSTSYYGTEANRIIRFCSSDGTLVLDSTAVARASISPDNSYGYFTVPSSWLTISEYICVNVRMNDKSSMIFAEGDTLPEYSEYFDPYTAVKESVLPPFVKTVNNISPDSSGNVNTSEDATVLHNPLYGKKLSFNGDSICYGEGYVGGYARIIGERNGATIDNIAISGATIASGTTSGGSNRHWISTTVTNMANDADYYIVEGGVNDSDGSLGVQLGTLSSGYTATLDTTTLIGAMEYICKTLQTTFVGKKYGFLFPHNVYGDTSAWNTTNREAMKTALRKWGIPYLDLSEACAQLRNIDALRIYTLNGDGWHPNEEGYRLFYVPKIEAWMRTL